MNDNQRKRLATYMNDPAIMGKLKQLVAHEQELFEFAMKHYEEQWSKPLQTC